MDNKYNKILNFLNQYAGQDYVAGQEPICTYGKLAYSCAELLGYTVESEIQGFKFIKSSKWQNSGHVAKYFWLQFKREKYSDEPYSISVTTVKKNGKYIFKVYVEISDDDIKGAIDYEKSLLKFNQAIVKIEQPNVDFYYEGQLRSQTWKYERIGTDINSIVQALSGKKYSKITTNIDLAVDETTTDESIVKEIVTAFKVLIPHYDAIWDVISKTQTWIIPCDIQQYDIIGAYKALPEIEWHGTQQTNGIKKGDKVFIYVNKPYSRLMYQCVVTDTNLPKQTIDDSQFVNSPTLSIEKELFRLKFEKQLNSLNLSLGDLNNNGFAGNVRGARKVSEETGEYIKRINAKSGNMPSVDENERDTIKGLSEQEIERIFDEKDDNAGYITKAGIIKTRKINKKIIDELKEKYKGQCQLCGTFAGKEIGADITEAHHIEYFSKTQNNDASNIIVLCPNCHALIHKGNPDYNKGKFSFDFSNGVSMPIKIAGHLKNV